jgi:hypothetical protein
MLANFMIDEEIRALIIYSCYLKYKILVIICIGYHLVTIIYSYIKCQCIRRELDLKVNGFKTCGVLHTLSSNF